MEKNLFELLNAVKLIDVVATSGLFIIILTILITQRRKIKEGLENWRKKKNFEDSAIDMINANTIKIEELEDTMLKARDTSREIREEMYEEIKDVSVNMKEVISTLKEMQEKEKLSKRADIKEKIEKIYRECNLAKSCTDMQLETLKDLIDDYERYEGQNSFVHSVVQKEMYTWEVMEKIPKQQKTS